MSETTTTDQPDYMTPEGEVYFDNDIGDQVEAILSDLYGAVDVCGYSFEAGQVLRLMDPVAFRQEVLDWVSNEIEEGRLLEYSEEELSGE